MNFILKKEYLKILPLLLWLTIVGCNDDFSYEYNPTVEAKFETLKTVADNDTVLVILPNFPKLAGITDEDTLNVSYEEFIAERLPYSAVKVLLAEDRDPNLLFQYYLSPEEMNEFITHSLDNIRDVVDELKKQNKFVIVYGEFYGAYFLLRYMAEGYELNADKYTLFSYRMKAEQVIIDKFFEYKLAAYVEEDVLFSEQYVGGKNNWAIKAILSNILSKEIIDVLPTTGLTNKVFYGYEEINNFGVVTPEELDYYAATDATAEKLSEGIIQPEDVIQAIILFSRN